MTKKVSSPRRPPQSWEDAAAMLWPDQPEGYAVRRVPRSTADASSWWVLPSARHPRFFVPVESPGGWRIVARTGAGGRADQMQALASRVLRSGIGKVLPFDRLDVEGRGIEQCIEDVLGQPARIGVRLGRARADRVLVLQVLAADGSTLAFAKLGTSEIADAGLTAEATNLRRIAELDPAGVGAPALLHQGTWLDHQLLVMSPVSGEPSVASDDVPVPAMRRLADAAGADVTSLGTSGFLARLRRDIARVREAEVRSTFESHLERVTSQFGSEPLWFGAWHGDWVPWNMARDGARVVLWDWEHYEEGVPRGFDALHFRGQQLRNADRKHLDRGEEVWWTERRALLAQLGVPAEVADLTAVLYLLRVNVRFVIEGQSDQEISPRRVGWALPLLARAVDDLATTGGGTDV